MAVYSGYLTSSATLETLAEDRYLNGSLRNAKMGTTELRSYDNTGWLASDGTRVAFLEG